VLLDARIARRDVWLGAEFTHVLARRRSAPERAGERQARDTISPRRASV
jgi:hypothetical protein